MKTTRKIAKNKFFASIMSFMLLFASTYKANAVNPIFEIDKDLTGEQMFKEIFFFENVKSPEILPVSIQASIKTMRNMDVKQLQSRKKAIDGIVSVIKKNSPYYFNSLKAAVESKNPYKIKNKLTEGGKIIIKAYNLTDKVNEYQKLYANKKIDLNNDKYIENFTNELKLNIQNDFKIRPTQTIEDTCIAVAIAAVAVLAVVGVAAVVVMYFWVSDFQKSGSFKNLTKDQYVTSIIKTYS